MLRFTITCVSYLSLHPQDLMKKVDSGDAPDLGSMEEFHTFAWLPSSEENSSVAELSKGALKTQAKKRSAPQSSAPSGSSRKKTSKKEPVGDNSSKAMSYFK